MLSSWSNIWDRLSNRGLSGKDFQKLRALGFNEDKISFQIVSIRHPDRATNAALIYGSPARNDWASNFKLIQKILLTAFPKLQTDSRQRYRAGRWARIIELYFRMGLSYSEVAEEIKENKGAVKTLIRSIQRRSRGEPAAGTKKTLDNRV